jgi:outer membrane lipoprotein carrier protein
MSKPMFKTLVVSCVVSACASLAQANGLDSLEQFVKSAKTGRAEFTQVVTAPAKEGQVARSKSSSGTFEFSRPKRFRFVYRKPFEQTIVADGQTLWLHDVDLNQVTSRKQAAVLAASPAALIASAADIRALQADFVLTAAPDKDGLQWVLASPKARDGLLQSVRVGFKAGDLSVLEMVDSFGQRSVMTFNGLRINLPVEAAVFEFQPPAGADLIQQ